MIAKKYLLLLIILPIFLLSLIATTVSVQAAFPPPYVKVYVDQPLGYLPFVAPGPFSQVHIDIIIETSGIVDLEPESIVGWGLYIQVDPAVLEVFRAKGAMTGYFLWTFADLAGTSYPSIVSNFDAPKGFGDVSEQISPTPSGGAGDYFSGLKLVTIDAYPLSNTRGCHIDVYNVEYMTPDGKWHPVDVIVDGYYGGPPPIGPRFMSETSGTYDPTQDPTDTTWHELYPNYSQMWDLVTWTDNGDNYLSASDQIDMVNETGYVHYWHVDAVTTTIHWTFKPNDINPTGDLRDAEPDESDPTRIEDIMTNPIGTYWHQLYPDYCRQFKITSWEDNGDGVFSVSDQFDFVYEDEPGVTYWAHLDAVTTDIILSWKGEGGVVPEFPLGLGLMLAIAPAIPIAYLWRLRRKVTKR